MWRLVDIFVCLERVVIPVVLLVYVSEQEQGFATDENQSEPRG